MSPVYDAMCKACGAKIIDIFALMPSATVMQKCHCGSTDFEKLPASPAVKFKGEGWATRAGQPPADKD